MDLEGFEIVNYPKLKQPVLIAGFSGWANALNISRGMVDYLVQLFHAEGFALIRPDVYFRYDESRPEVKIHQGFLRKITLPGGGIFAVKGEIGQRDLLILASDEPTLRWQQFCEELMEISQEFEVSRIITLGSMLDQVLHTDRFFSAAATTRPSIEKIKAMGLNTVEYSGPSVIHSLILWECLQRAFPCCSIWSHAPFYLQGITHYGMIAELGKILSQLCGFQFSDEDLIKQNDQLEIQIQNHLKDNDEIKQIVARIEQFDNRGQWKNMKPKSSKDANIINLKDFKSRR